MKKNVTILVTDSGLGGLSIAANLTTRLAGSGFFETADIVFFNAQFHDIGYNGLKSGKEKIRILNTVLKTMKKKYHPDLLLIACNTLSILYDKTPFCSKASFPVIGIVEVGVDLIAKQFDKSPDATAIIFATKTTIGSNTHKNLLINRGYSEHKIVGQACHHLAGSIERGYNSEETIELIRKYIREAFDNLEVSNPNIFASLNCTHYGYSIQQFRDVFAELGHPAIEIIDPNPEMVNFIFKPAYLNRYPKTDVSAEVVSKLKITEKEINSLYNLLSGTSPITAEALKNYHFDPDLFKVKFDSTRID